MSAICEGVLRRKPIAMGMRGRLVGMFQYPVKDGMDGLVVTVIGFPDEQLVRVRADDGQEAEVLHWLIERGSQVFINGVWCEHGSERLLDYYEAQLRRIGQLPDPSQAANLVAFYERALNEGGRPI